MPARSNDFQKVVFLIQQHLAVGSKVRESVLFNDLHTGTPREVDVVIETEIAKHPVIVSIECRDHVRPQNVSWINEMDSKHRALPTNLLVLVSSSGFTNAARKKAAACNIDLAVPTALTDAEASVIAGRVSGLRLKTAKMKVVESVAHVEALKDMPNELVRNQNPALTLFSSNRTPLGDLNGFCSAAMRLADWSQLLRDATGAEKGFGITVSPPCYTLGKQSRRPRYFYLENSETKALRRITDIRVLGDVKIDVADVPLTHAEMRGTGYSYGRTNVMGQDALVVITHTDAGPGKLSVSFGSKEPIAQLRKQDLNTATPDY